MLRALTRRGRAVDAGLQHVRALSSLRDGDKLGDSVKETVSSDQTKPAQYVQLTACTSDATSKEIGKFIAAQKAIPENWERISQHVARCFPEDSDFVHVHRSAPPLIKIPQRSWGPPAHLDLDDIGKITGGDYPYRIATMRHAFAPHDHITDHLSDTLRTLRHGTVAVNATIADPAERVLVDEYVRDDEAQRYTVQRVGTDLLRWLRQHRVRVCHVPKVGDMADYNSYAAAERSVRQSTNEVLMVAPTAFTFNEQAAQDNTFMHQSGDHHAGDTMTKRVLREFAGLHYQLTEVAGVQVTLFEHGAHHGTPDAVFPNNWFSTHQAEEAAGGSTLVLYPMKCPNRQAERREDMVQLLMQRGYDTVLDLTEEEQDQRYFEGTGVLVLDRVNKVVYCALSERADIRVAERWTDELGYKDLVTFQSTDRHGKLVYHTNVMMAVGTDAAVVCLESVEDPKEQQRLVDALEKHHTVVDITRTQMESMCGNVLELEDGRGLPVLAMSTRAHNAFTPEQRSVLRRHVAGFVHAPISTLEHVGGGGVRCTLAELF